MNVTESLDAPCSPAELFAFVDDLERYPAWLDLVHRAVPDGPATWLVDLRAHLGPLARSKRLRMERTEHDPAAGRARFDRHELDGRKHAPWVLTATVVPTGATASMLTMDLHYGGRLWTGGVLERVLREQIQSGRARLLELVRPTH